MMLFEHHPYFVQRRSRASRYRRPCSSRVWLASRVGTLPSFFRAGRRLYRSSTAHQCWCFTSTVDVFSFLILAFVCHAYPAFVIHSRFAPKLHTLSVACKFCFYVLFFSVCTSLEPLYYQVGTYCSSTTPRRNTSVRALL